MRTCRHSFARLALTAAAVVFAGCMSTWTDKPGPQHSDKIDVTAELPSGWARYNPDDGIVMTRDGLLLQRIEIKRDKYGARIENTDRTITEGAEAYDAAQIVIDAMKADQTRAHLTILDNKPVTVAGYPGFMLDVTYQTADGLTMRETRYVALTEDSYVIISYTAPNRYYHERDAGDFQRVLASVKINPQTKKSS